MLTAWRVGLSPLMVGLLISFSYGFGYTGHIARGFALAHLLIAVTVFAVVEVVRSGVTAPRSSLAWAAIAGLASGLATMTNYLAVFPAAAVLAWVFFAAVSWKRHLWIVFTAGIPFCMTMIISLYFFVVQKDSRTGQFEPFSPFSMLARLAQFNMANLFGGLPLYVEGAARTAVGGSLAVLLLVVVAAAAYRWRQLGQTRWLWLSGALAPSAGLVGLGIAFGNSPVELRYVAFAAPFAAMLIASAATAWGRLAPVATAAVLGLVLTVQFAGTLGMQLHSATQQPFRLAIAAASPYLGDSSVLLVPFGNDGVGITGSVLREISPAQSVLTMSNTNAQSVPLRASAYKMAVMFGVSDRDGREQINVASAALRGHPSWCSSGIVWHDFRGGYIEVFDHVLPQTSCPVR
ncbi:hypothetical protein ACFQY5_08420 [Paeniroseomonas aquatica]